MRDFAICFSTLFCLAMQSADAQTWQKPGTATLPVVTENSACNTAKDTVGISADRRVLMSCQAGTWKKNVAGGTGISGILSPLSGMSISCTTTDPTSGIAVTGYAMVDAQGRPFTRLVWHTYDTGYVVGFYAENTVNGWNKNVRWSLGYPNLGVYVTQGDGTSKLGCTASWPIS